MDGKFAGIDFVGPLVPSRVVPVGGLVRSMGVEAFYGWCEERWGGSLNGFGCMRALGLSSCDCERRCVGASRIRNQGPWAAGCERLSLNLIGLGWVSGHG